MKKYGIMLVATTFLFACGEEVTTDQPANEETTDTTGTSQAAEGYSLYGPEAIADMNAAVDVGQFMGMMEGNTEMDVTLSATIKEVCQKAGCWIKVELNDSTDMRVFFKDHFTIPVETGQVPCVIQGTAWYDTISVEDQRHFLEDGNAPKEEVDAITEPKYMLAFTANAIALKEE